MDSNIPPQPLNLLVYGTHLEFQDRQNWFEAGQVGHENTEGHALCAGEAQQVRYSQVLQSEWWLHYNQG